MTLLNSTTFADHTNNHSILSGVFESNFGMGGGEGVGSWMSQSSRVQIPRDVEALNDQCISICCSQLTNQIQLIEEIENQPCQKVSIQE